MVEGRGVHSLTSWGWQFAGLRRAGVRVPMFAWCCRGSVARYASASRIGTAGVRRAGAGSLRSWNELPMGIAMCSVERLVAGGLGQVLAPRSHGSPGVGVACARRDPMLLSQM